MYTDVSDNYKLRRAKKRWKETKLAKYGCLCLPVGSKSLGCHRKNRCKSNTFNLLHSVSDGHKAKGVELVSSS